MKSCSRNQYLSITDNTYIRAWSYHAYRYPIPSYQYNSVSNSPTQIFPICYCDIAVHRSHHTLHFLLFVSLLHTQHATSTSNPTSIKTFTTDARGIFIPCYNYVRIYKYIQTNTQIKGLTSQMYKPESLFWVNVKILVIICLNTFINQITEIHGDVDACQTYRCVPI